jgi:P27 family predicted phage terminase small subunit
MAGIKGLSGRRKTPSVQLALGGSKRGESRIIAEPKRIEALPVKPLGMSDVAAEVWGHYEKMLTANGTLSAADGLALQQLCECHAEWHEANEFIRKYGTSFIDDAGNVRPYLAVKQRSDSRKDLLRYIREFGLSPCSRGGVKALDMEDNELENVT